MIVSALENRFWAKVAIPRDPYACWEWRAATRNGYGVIGRGGRNEGVEYAHRLAYSLFNEFIPDGMEVCHACNNRLCVNPLHLYEGTRSDNMKQASRQGRLRGTFPKGKRSGAAIARYEETKELKRRAV